MRVRIHFFIFLSILVVVRGLSNTLGIEFFVKLLSEAIILLWFSVELGRSNTSFMRLPLYFVFSYLFWVGLVAMKYQDYFEYYVYVRHTLLGLLTLYIAYNIPFLDGFVRIFLRTLDWIVISQIVSAIFVYFFIGRLERYVGTMSSSGGSLATVWPLTFAPYYYFRYVATGKWKYLALLIGLIFIGYASGKRAVYFVIPTSVLIIYILTGWKVLRNYSYSLRLVGSGVILFLALLVGIVNTESLAQSNGFSIKALNTAFSYVGEYSNAESKINGESIGRSSSTKNTVSAMLKDKSAFFGHGLNTLKGEISFSPYNIGYGITGFMREAISLGLIGGLLYLSIFLSLFRGLLRAKDLIHKKRFNDEVIWLWFFCFSGLISILITSIGYSRVFSQSLNPLVFTMLSLGLFFRVIKKVQNG